MPPFPHENLDQVQVTLEELCTEAHHLAVDPVPAGIPENKDYHVANLMLGGRLLHDDGVTTRVVVQPPERHPAGDPMHPDTAQRSYGHMTGVVRELNLNARLTVTPIPLKTARMENRLNIEVDVDDGGYETSLVKVNLLPHFLIANTRATDEYDLTIWMCFPELYYKGVSTHIWEAWVGEFYASVMYPALNRHCVGFRNPGPRAVWKPTFEATEALEQKDYGVALTTTQGLRAGAVLGWSRDLIERADGNTKFRKAFYVVDYVPKANWHDSNDEVARRDAWTKAVAPIAALDDYQHWKVKVDLKCGQPGMVVLWQPRGMLEWLSYELPHVSEGDLGKLLENSMERAAQGATEWSRSYVAVDVKKIAAAKGYVEVRFGVEDGRELELNTGWRAYEIPELLPRAINKLVEDVRHTLRILRATADLDAADGKIPCGVATVGVTMKLDKADEALRTVEDRQDLFYVVPAKIWWTYKTWRINAIHQVLARLSGAPPEVRGQSLGSLGLGVVAIDCLNAVVVPQPVPEALSRVRSLAAFHHVSEAQSVADIEHGWATGTQQPALQSRGVYFASGIKSTELPDGGEVWILPGVAHGDRELDLADLAILYGFDAVSKLRAAFGLGSHRTRRIPGAMHIVDRIIRGRYTLPELPFNRAHRPKLSFGLADSGIKPQADVADILREVPDLIRQGMKDEAVEEILAGGNIESILTNIFCQMVWDMVARAPNRTNGGPTYVTLGPAERDNVPFAWLEQPTLTFNDVNIARANEDVWGRAVGHILPYKGSFRGGAARGFDQATYLRAWVELLNRLSEDDAYVVTEASHRRLKQVAWLPEVSPGALWTSRTPAITAKVLHLPRGRVGAGPVILASPRRYRDLNNMQRFRLRDVPSVSGGGGRSGEMEDPSV